MKMHEINKTLEVLYSNAHTTNTEKIDVVWVGGLGRGRAEERSACACMFAVCKDVCSHMYVALGINHYSFY